MFKDFKNNLDFFIRNKTKFSRKNYLENNLELLERNRLENLYIKDVLDKSFEKISQDSVHVLDIGSKNWFYVKGEYNFFDTFCSRFFLDGVELDAYRLYSNFYSRYEVAKYHMRDLKNVKYYADDLLNINKKYDYIIWFLPFITINPHVFWGLPIKYFCPEIMLKHAYSLLNEKGQMLIVNQGEKEKEVQKRMLQNLNIGFTELGKIESKHFEYQNKRFGFLVKKWEEKPPNAI